MPQPFVNVTTRIYNFGDRLKNPNAEDMPISLEIHLTNLCNSACVFCWTAENDIPRTHTLPLNAVLQAVRDVAAGGGLSVVLSGGGEPTLYSGFRQVSDEVVRNGMRLGVITNGLHYDREIEAGLLNASWVKFSLNGANQGQYQQQTRARSATAFQHVTSHIKRFVAAKSSDTVVSASLVVNGLNQTDEAITGFFDYAATELGVSYVLFRPYIGENPELIVTRSKQELSTLASILGGKSKEKGVFTNFHALVRDANAQRQEMSGKCPLVQSSLLGAITSDGNVHVCLPLPRMGRQDLSVGSINENSFKEIWTGERRKKVLAELFNRDCPPCKYERMFGLAEDIKSERADVPREMRRDPHWCFL